MSNHALPQKSRQMLENYLDQCQNLSLILDKFAPWGDDGRGRWDLVMRSTIRRQGQNQVQTLSGGEAKGLWLSTTRKAIKDESRSLFEAKRTDTDLMKAYKQRWENTVRASSGTAFTLMTAERLVAGLGASHVLETALTLDRNTGLPYLPGSTVKGLARAWGLIEVAAQLEISLDDKDASGEYLLNVLAKLLISEADDKLIESLQKLRQVSSDAETYAQWFRFIFGSQVRTGMVCFMDAIYAGESEPIYASDVMTPHYVNYYTENGVKPPTEDDNPNPVSFITVDAGNPFTFGLLPRRATETADNQKTALDTAASWLVNGLTQMGIGSKTAAGYGFFNRKSLKPVITLS